jgi:ATP-dependent DNA ligase
LVLLEIGLPKYQGSRQRSVAKAKQVRNSPPASLDSGEQHAKSQSTDSRLATAQVRFIEPMYALAVKNLSEGKDWLYGVKFDGYRCFAGRRDNGVTLWSRRGNLFTGQFQHIARAASDLRPIHL